MCGEPVIFGFCEPMDNSDLKMAIIINEEGEVLEKDIAFLNENDVRENLLPNSKKANYSDQYPDGYRYEFVYDYQKAIYATFKKAYNKYIEKERCRKIQQMDRIGAVSKNTTK